VRRLHAVVSVIIGCIVVVLYALMVRQMLEHDDRLRITMKRLWKACHVWFRPVQRWRDRQMIHDLLRPTQDGEEDSHAAR
jgi:hypothetical protein